MTVIKVEDLAYVRFRAPDLGQMRRFLIDFGLTDAPSSVAGNLHMRGTGSTPAIHITEPGMPGFAGFAFRAASLADLRTLAQAEGADVVPLEGPQGGWIVRLEDPDGFPVDVVAGQAGLPTMPHHGGPAWNTANGHNRIGVSRRVVSGPASVLRLGHIVLFVSNLQASWAWYQSRFGLVVSDDVQIEGNSIAMFVRCDRGGIATDHHTLNLAQAPDGVAAFHHAAYEVADLDDLMAGSVWLAGKDHQHMWGVGRHILGSQVFDYWRDPWGHIVEHWTDGDMLPSHVPAQTADLAAMTGLQWGPDMPAGFV